MSTVLCIDTASGAFALALAVDGEVVASMARDAGRDHSRRLLTAIDEMLGERKDDLSAVAVVTGPGSYAGLRVGIATAEGLALSRLIPITGVPTMEAIMRASGMRDGIVVHPAGRDQLACQDVRDGVLTGPLVPRPMAEVSGAAIAGEGAGELGGVDVTPEARCVAALQLALERAGRQAGSGLDAIYLHEPHITVSRRKVTAQTTSGETS